MFFENNKTIIWILARLQSHDGQALAEYGLVVAFIAMVCIAALTVLGLWAATSLDSFTSALRS